MNIKTTNSDPHYIVICIIFKKQIYTIYVKGGEIRMEFINLTPHALTVHRVDDSVITIPASGNVARVSQHDVRDEVVDGIEINHSQLGEVEGLPQAEDGKIFIVSRLVATAVKDRLDVVVPGILLRDEQGRVVGCKGFARV